MTHPKLKLRHLDLRLDLEIDDARDRPHFFVHLLSRHPKLAEIRPENLDGDLSPNARHDVVEAVRDRLPDIDLHPRDARHLHPNVGQYLVARSPSPLDSPQMRDWYQSDCREQRPWLGSFAGKEPDIDLR